MRSKTDSILEGLRNKTLVESTTAETIKESFDEDKAKKEVLNDKTFKRLKAFCNKHGYDVDLAFIKKQDNYYRVVFNPYVKDRTNKYLRDLYVNTNLGKDAKSVEVYVTANTTSFGSLDKKQYSEYCKAVRDTNDLLFALDDFDFNKLPVIDMEGVV